MTQVQRLMISGHFISFFEINERNRHNAANDHERSNGEGDKTVYGQLRFQYCHYYNDVRMHMYIDHIITVLITERIPNK
jgi:hypothetical protein